MKCKNVLLMIVWIILLSASVLAGTSTPYQFAFDSQDAVLWKLIGGYNFDNDGNLDIVGIAALLDEQGEVSPRSSFLVHFEESEGKSLALQWAFRVNHDVLGDFTDACLADIDGDGQPEIAAVFEAQQYRSEHQPFWLYVFEYADGFSESPVHMMNAKGSFYLRPRPKFISAADISGNGNDELLVTSGSPMKGISVLQLQGGQLSFLFQSYELEILEGIYPCRAIGANLLGDAAMEILLLGGKDRLRGEVYALQDPAEPLTAIDFRQLTRSRVRLQQSLTCDLDGNGLHEIIVPVRAGGAQLIWSDGKELLQSPFITEDADIAALTAADLDGNRLDEIVLNVAGRPELLKYEFGRAGYIADLHNYSQFLYEEEQLKKADFLQVAPVVNGSGDYTGAIVLPFRHSRYVDHSMFYWALAPVRPLMDMSAIEMVLEDVDEALAEQPVVEVVQEESSEVSSIEVKPETIEKEPEGTEPQVMPKRDEYVPSLIFSLASGGLIPAGGNLRNNYNMGLPISFQFKIPSVTQLGEFPVNMGVESGYFWVKDPTNVKKDLRGAPLYLIGEVDMSALMPGDLVLSPELGVGLHMQISDGPFSGSYLAWSPRVMLGYKTNRDFMLFAKLGATQVLSNYDLGGSASEGGTQEWVDFRLGFEYILHRKMPDYAAIEARELLPAFQLGAFGGARFPFGKNISDAYEMATPILVQGVIPGLTNWGNVQFGGGFEVGYYHAKSKTAGGDPIYAMPLFLVTRFDFSHLLPDRVTFGAELAGGVTLQSEEKLSEGTFVYASASPRLTIGYRISQNMELSAKFGAAEVATNYDFGWTTGKSAKGTQEWIEGLIGLSYLFSR